VPANINVKTGRGGAGRSGFAWFCPSLEVGLDALATLTIVNKLQTHQPNTSHIKQEGKFVEEDSSID
jgi:hypothetical protein